MAEKKLEKLKFGPTKYVPWRFGIESVLKGKELWEVCVLQNPQADPQPEAKDAAPAPAANIMAKKDKAKAEIITYLDHTYVVKVGTLNDPVDILREIEECNVPQSIEAIADMQSVLENLKFEGGSKEQLNLHFTEMSAYRELLRLAGVVHSEPSWLMKIIESVSISAWETNITVLKSTPTKESAVIAKFNHLLELRPVKKSTVLSYEEKKEEDRRCFKCNSIGHLKADCPQNRNRSGYNGKRGAGHGGRGHRGRGRGRGRHHQGGAHLKDEVPLLTEF
jgi:hypothetical protein